MHETFSYYILAAPIKHQSLLTSWDLPQLLWRVCTLRLHTLTNALPILSSRLCCATRGTSTHHIKRYTPYWWHKLHLHMDHAQLSRIECVLLALNWPWVHHLAVSINNALPCPEDAPLVATADVALEPLNFEMSPTS